MWSSGGACRAASNKAEGLAAPQAISCVASNNRVRRAALRPAQKPCQNNDEPEADRARIAQGRGNSVAGRGLDGAEAADFDPVSKARLRMKALPRGARASKRLTRGGRSPRRQPVGAVAQIETLPIVTQMSRFDPTVFIRANLPVAAVPGVPEIKLHKASPTSGLWRLAHEDEDGFGAPYWAHYWAGGLALARYVLDNPAVVAGLRVLDLGAGSGLVGIAAAKAGAREVIAAEVDPYAVAALKLNMKLNGVSISVVRERSHAGDPPARNRRDSRRRPLLRGGPFGASHSLPRSVFELRNSGAYRRSLARPPANLAAHGIGALCGHRRREATAWGRAACLHFVSRPSEGGQTV